jgi:hypothetical protein
MQFLIGLILFSQLIAGARDCSGRRDDCETNESAYQASVTISATYGKSDIG